MLRSVAIKLWPVSLLFSSYLSDLFQIVGATLKGTIAFKTKKDEL